MKNIDSQEIEAEHLKRVVIYNGHNGLAIDVLKEISEEKKEEQKNFYDKWENFFFFSNGSHTENIWSRKYFVYGYIVLFSIATIVAYKFFRSVYVLGFGLALIAECIYFLGQKKGHGQGYLDGYEFGIRDGVDKALGIDDADKQLIQKEREAADEFRIEMGLSKLLRDMDEHQESE